MADRLVTIIGGSGFIGRYVVQELMRRGARVRVAGRDPKAAFFLKPLGGLGQTQFVAADITKPATIARAVQGSDAVINLVGILNGAFRAIHHDGAETVAKAAAAAGADALVHVSAIGADSESESAYAASKGDGEQAVRAAFPSATILRPSIVFGPEDKFVNRFAALIAALPFVPIIAPNTRMQPVFVADVARAIATAAMEPEAHSDKVYELGGPEVLSMEALNRKIADFIGRGDTSLVPLPDMISDAIATFTGWAPGAPITRDQWRMLQRDNVVGEGARTLADLGIAGTPLAAVAESWLVRYRKHGRFAGRASA